MPHRRVVPAYLVGETSHAVVFACGDPVHADPSVAAQACTSLPPQTLAVADVTLIADLRPEYLRDLPAGVRAIVVDTVVGAKHGEIVDVALIDMSGRADSLVTSANLQLPLDQVVAMAQLLRDTPVEGRFIGIGTETVVGDQRTTSGSTDLVAPLRDAVARAAEELASPA